MKIEKTRKRLKKTRKLRLAKETLKNPDSFVRGGGDTPPNTLLITCSPYTTHCVTVGCGV